MRRSFKFLLRPTARQVAALSACLEDHRAMYNAALEERREAWRRARITVRYGDQSAQLKEIRRADPGEQGRWSFSSQQATLRRLNKAMAAFFRRVRTGGKPGYPRFKGRGWFDAVEWPKDGDGCRWDSTPHDSQTRVYLQGVGHVRVHQHRHVTGRVKTIQVKREGRRWHLILSCDEVPAEPLPATGRVAGIDLGVAHFAATSDGHHLPNPRHLARSEKRLAAAQRAHARTRRGSSRRRKAARRIAAVHAKVARQRRDCHHKSAVRLVRAYDTLAYEELKTAAMTRSARGTAEQPGRNVAAKAGLNKSILDAGWSGFLRILRGKAESAGRELILVNPAGTSQTCARCGHRDAGNRLTQAEFVCLACGHTANADINAAQVIAQRAGLVRRNASAA